MSRSTHIRGFIPPDEKFTKMLEAYHACEAAGVAIPPDVEKFFDGRTPDEAGVEIDLSGRKYDAAVKEFHAEMQEGFEIDLTKLAKLSKDIKVIRFVNSY